MGRRLVPIVSALALVALALAAPSARRIDPARAGPLRRRPRHRRRGRHRVQEPAGQQSPSLPLRRCRRARRKGRLHEFLALGDDQYEYGRYKDFIENYDVYFGSLLPITEPVPGNHEYGTPDGAGYYRYFGASVTVPAATTPTTSARGTSSP